MDRVVPMSVNIRQIALPMVVCAVRERLPRDQADNFRSESTHLAINFKAKKRPPLSTGKRLYLNHAVAPMMKMTQIRFVEQIQKELAEELAKVPYDIGKVERLANLVAKLAEPLPAMR